MHYYLEAWKFSYTKLCFTIANVTELLSCIVQRKWLKWQLAGRPPSPIWKTFDIFASVVVLNRVWSFITERVMGKVIWRHMQNSCCVGKSWRKRKKENKYHKITQKQTLWTCTWCHWNIHIYVYFSVALCTCSFMCIFQWQYVHVHLCVFFSGIMYMFIYVYFSVALCTCSFMCIFQWHYVHVHLCVFFSGIMYMFIYVYISWRLLLGDFR